MARLFGVRRRGRRLAMLLLAVGLFVSGARGKSAPATTAAAKMKPPAAAEIAEAGKVMADVYKDAIAKLNTPGGKAALAGRMLGDASNEKDVAARFALLARLRDLSGEAGDLHTALEAIDALDGSYDIDRFAMAVDAATAAGRTAQGDLSAEGAKEIIGLLQGAVAAERYDAANKLAAAGIAMARVSGDAALSVMMTTRTLAVRDAENLAREAKKAMETLATKPADAPANLTAGKYLCFVREDWAAGLPMLALGADETLKALAVKEMANPAESEGQMALGDAWWSAADKTAGLAKLGSLKRAGKWYSAALPGAAAGLAKSRAETRMKTLAAMEPAKPIDLIKLIDGARDAVLGRWTVRDGELVSETEKEGRLEILYEPPAEYDFKIVFTRATGGDAIMLICPAASHQFDFILGGYANTKSGFELIKGERLNANPSAKVATAWLENGRRYTSVVKVRKDKVQAYLDNRLIAEWKTNYSDMSLPGYYALPHANALGVGNYWGNTVFHKVELIEVTGHGSEIK